MGPFAQEIHTSPAMAKEETEAEAYVTVSTPLPEKLVTLLPSGETVAPAAATEEARADVTATIKVEPKDGVVIEEGTSEASGERCF